MSLTSRELADLLRSTLPGAAPRERRHVETTVDLIERSNIIARTDSPSSVFLRETVDQYMQFFTPDAAERIASTEIYGVDLPVFNAFARKADKTGQVIVFDGIRQVIMFYAQLIHVLNLLQTLRSDRRIQFEHMDETECHAFSLAAFSVLANYLNTGRPLGAVGDILGPNARRTAEIGYMGAIAFITAHELGHLALGHTGVRGVVPERNAFPLAIEEHVNEDQYYEFEADDYALAALRPEKRVDFMASILFYMGPCAFLEAFGRVEGESHPLFVNRAEHLASQLIADAETAAMIRRIIEGQVAGFRNVATIRQGLAGDIRYRIHDTMPVETAYEVIAVIKDRVRTEIGVLELQDQQDVAG